MLNQHLQEAKAVWVVAKPNSKCFKVEGYRPETNELVVRLKSAPKSGKANKELIKELGALFGCGVRILRGHGSKRKLLLLEDVTGGHLTTLVASSTSIRP
jgi:uncharacterized protein (TIGR00251 family)